MKGRHSLKKEKGGELYQDINQTIASRKRHLEKGASTKRREIYYLLESFFRGGRRRVPTSIAGKGVR